MACNAKNWTQRRVALGTGAYTDALANKIEIQRKGFVIINDTANPILMYLGGLTAPGSDTDSYTLAAGKAYDFLEQPPIGYVWLKATVGAVSPLIIEA